MKYLQRLLILMLLLSAMAFSACPAFGGVISQSESFYVADDADVISEDTEKYIIEKNAELEYLCGGQIVVATVDFLDGMDIEDYAYKLFNNWQIGGEDNDNGILLLLAIGEENYWCMQGKGLESSLTAGDIDDILWYYLEDDFAAGDYDSGVRSVFDALYEEVASIYSSGSTYTYEEEEPSDFLSLLAGIIFIIIVILVVRAVFRSLSRARRRGKSSSGSMDGMGGMGGTETSRRSTRPIFIPASRPPRPPRPSGSSRSTRNTVSSSRPSRPSGGSSRSSFGGGSRSSSRSSGGLGRGGGGSSRGGGAGRRGR